MRQTQQLSTLSSLFPSWCISLSKYLSRFFSLFLYFHFSPLSFIPFLSIFLYILLSLSAALSDSLFRSILLLSLTLSFSLRLSLCHSLSSSSPLRPYSLSFSSVFLSPFLFLSLMPPLSLFLLFSPSLSRPLSLFLSPSLSFSLPLSRSLSLLLFPLSHSLSLSHPLFSFLTSNIGMIFPALVVLTQRTGGLGQSCDRHMKVTVSPTWAVWFSGRLTTSISFKGMFSIADTIEDNA